MPPLRETSLLSLLTRSDFAKLEVPLAELCSWIGNGWLEQIGTTPTTDEVGGEPVYAIMSRRLRAELLPRLGRIGKAAAALTPIRARSQLLRLMLARKGILLPFGPDDDVASLKTKLIEELASGLLGPDLAKALEEAAADLEREVDDALHRLGGVGPLLGPEVLELDDLRPLDTELMLEACGEIEELECFDADDLLGELMEWDESASALRSMEAEDSRSDDDAAHEQAAAAPASAEGTEAEASVIAPVQAAGEGGDGTSQIDAVTSDVAPTPDSVQVDATPACSEVTIDAAATETPVAETDSETPVDVEVPVDTESGDIAPVEEPQAVAEASAEEVVAETADDEDATVIEEPQVDIEVTAEAESGDDAPVEEPQAVAEASAEEAVAEPPSEQLAEVAVETLADSAPADTFDGEGTVAEANELFAAATTLDAVPDVEAAPGYDDSSEISIEPTAHGEETITEDELASLAGSNNLLDFGVTFRDGLSEQDVAERIVPQVAMTITDTLVAMLGEDGQLRGDGGNAVDLQPLVKELEQLRLTMQQLGEKKGGEGESKALMAEIEQLRQAVQKLAERPETTVDLTPLAAEIAKLSAAVELVADRRGDPPGIQKIASTLELGFAKVAATPQELLTTIKNVGKEVSAALRETGGGGQGMAPVRPRSGPSLMPVAAIGFLLACWAAVLYVKFGDARLALGSLLVVSMVGSTLMAFRKD